MLLPISVLAPISVFEPIFAPSRITAPMPISVLSPMVQPWTMAMWPMVTLRPTVQGNRGSTWMTAPSCTLLSSPMVMTLSSPRKVALNQMLAPFFSTTRPITSALGATQTSSLSRVGRWSPMA